MHILIVEDEKKTAAFLQKGLAEHGYTVDVCHDGEAGLILANSVAFDLMIFDIMLPLMDGLTLLKKIRANNQHTPVLFLSARDTLEDRVKGLEFGADDYLVKPFAFVEVLARVRSLLRRGVVLQPEQLRIADLTLDRGKHKAYRAGQLLDLTPKEFALLALFMQRPGEVLSRTLIAEQVWDINFDFDSNIIDVAIRRLRQKMDDAYNPKLLHTVRGMGYVFEAR